MTPVGFFPFPAYPHNVDYNAESDDFKHYDDKYANLNNTDVIPNDILQNDPDTSLQGKAVWLLSMLIDVFHHVFQIVFYFVSDITLNYINFLRVRLSFDNSVFLLHPKKNSYCIADICLNCYHCIYSIVQSNAYFIVQIRLD